MTNLKKILYGVSIDSTIGKMNKEVVMITTDSRLVKKKYLFIAINGSKYNGDDFIDQSIEYGASVIVSENFPKIINDKVTYIKVENIKKCLAIISNNFYEYPSKKIKLIGITGTNGKTSTALLLAQALRYQNKKIGVISSEGSGVYPNLAENEYTTPPLDINYKYLRSFCKKKCDYVIIECSSQGLHQGRLDGIHFTYSIITNIDQDHIEYHKSQKNYINSKLKILNQSRISILNFDSKNLKNIDHLKYDCKKIFYISQNKMKNKKILNTSL